MERVGKVTAIVRRGTDVLVFDHPLDEGGSMIQLPAGTIEAGEAPEVAAARELFEETGVRAVPLVLAGVRDETWNDQLRRRWVFLFDAPAGLAEEWPRTCDCGAPIRCYWLPLATASIVEPQQPWLDMARARLRERIDER